MEQICRFRASGMRTQQALDSRREEAAQQPAVKQLIKLKILLVGSKASGKTSIVKRYAEQYFTSNYQLTLGADLATKYLSWDKTAAIELSMWDIAGQERVGCMTQAFYKGADGYAIVYDLSRSETFDDVLRWKTDLDSSVRLNGARLPCVLLGNKCDLTTDSTRFLTTAEMDTFCDDNGIAAWFETSAKTSANIEKAFVCLISKVLYTVRRIEPPRRWRAYPAAAAGDRRAFFQRRTLPTGSAMPGAPFATAELQSS